MPKPVPTRWFHENYSSRSCITMILLRKHRNAIFYKYIGGCNTNEFLMHMLRLWLLSLYLSCLLYSFTHTFHTLKLLILSLYWTVQTDWRNSNTLSEQFAEWTRSNHTHSIIIINVHEKFYDQIDFETNSNDWMECCSLCILCLGN